MVNKRPVIKNLAVVLLVLIASQASGQGTYSATASYVSEAILNRQYDLAVLLLEPEAASGNAEAQYELGNLYRLGLGVQKDIDRAISWYELAAKQNHQRADRTLAVIRNKLAVGTSATEREITQSKIAVAGVDQPLISVEPVQDGSELEEGISVDYAVNAIQKNDIHTVEAYLQRGDPDLKDSMGRTLLTESIMDQKNDLLDLLLEKGATVNPLDESDLKPLWLAVSYGNSYAIDKLLQVGANVSSVDEFNNSLMHLAVSLNNVSLIKQLLAAKVPVDKPNDFGITPLQMAKNKKYKNILGLFEINGAAQKPASEKPVVTAKRWNENLEGDVFYGWPILHQAVWRGDIQVIKELISQGVDLRAKDREGYTALARGVQSGQRMAVEMLLNELSPLDGGEFMALIKEAMARKDPKILLDLLSRTKSYDPNLLLKLAVENRLDEVIGFLLESTHPTGLAQDVLITAAQNGDLLVIEYANNKGQKLSISDANGNSLISLAVDSGNQELVEYLLKIGMASPEANAFGETPLTKAIRYKSVQMVNTLVSDKDMAAGMINTITELGNTPLMLAVVSRQPDIARELIAKGADIYARNSESYTALMLSAVVGTKECAQILLDAGDTVTRNNRDGKNSIELAESHGNIELADYLKTIKR